MPANARFIYILPLAFLIVAHGQRAVADFELVRDGAAACQIVVDATGAQGDGAATLTDAATWLADCLQLASGAKLPVVAEMDDQPCVVIARADAHPKVARRAGLQSTAYDAFCIVAETERLHILGNSEAAARHGVATLLRQWGFRWFASSPRWHVVPTARDFATDLTAVNQPRLAHRGIWYAYAGGDKALMENYRRWAIANRLSVSSVIRTGHSYGNIIGPNKAAFETHPEYFALLPDGQRDNQRSVNARKFCFSNPGLIELVVQDRTRLLDEYRRANAAAYMVSMDPSDGEGTCHCEECAKLGTTTDRVLHLANQVARGIRAEHPDGWVGLYAYSSHRLPPTIKVEPNVYVQVAMGFNRTEFTLPELVERWSDRVGAIGLREYYGVEAWDWGLPGRMRGSSAEYHRKWIPYYADRKLNAINAETNANWGGQALGLYIASQLMWDPSADVDRLTNEFIEHCYGRAAEPMRRLTTRFDDSPPLRAATLVPMFQDLVEARTAAAGDPAVQRRLVDMMAYLVYVAKFRNFDLVRNRRSTRDDEYYAALLPLMNYAWRIRMRDVVHYYALARRLCNGLPVQDEHPEFYMFNKETPPIWMHGEQLADDDVVTLFDEYLRRLESDGNPVVTYSRYLDPVNPPGDDAGPSRQFLQTDDGVATFRHRLTGYLIPSRQQSVRLGIAPTNRSATLTVYLRGDTVLFEQTYKQKETFATIEIELPKANEYRVEIVGGVKLQIPAETPFVFEASAANPAWIDYSGPQYFYVPQGARELIVDANPRLSFYVPGQKDRVDVALANRQTNKDYAVIDVPPAAAGKVWHTSNQTRGAVSLLNIPPLLSFHRRSVFVPREVAEADGLTTRGR